MMRHMESYVATVNADPIAGMRQYLDQFVFGPSSWTEFLERIGVDELIRASRAGRSIDDA
jgi:glutaconate CoA-transferase subunit A